MNVSNITPQLALMDPQLLDALGYRHRIVGSSRGCTVPCGRVGHSCGGAAAPPARLCQSARRHPQLPAGV